MKRKTFLIDFDGTLCQTHPAIKHGLVTLFHQRGDSRLLEEAISASIASGATLSGTIQRLQPAGVMLTPEQLEGWIADYRRIYASSSERLVELFPNVKETLEEISTESRLVVLSNKGADAIKRSLQIFDIERYFSLIIAEVKGLPAKPDGRVFVERLQPAFPGLMADQCIVVGDTSADLLFARNIGATAVFASYGYGSAEECEALGYDYRIGSFAEIVTLVMSVHRSQGQDLAKE